VIFKRFSVCETEKAFVKESVKELKGKERYSLAKETSRPASDGGIYLLSQRERERERYEYNIQHYQH
jgi:hypothetical protein